MKPNRQTRFADLCAELESSLNEIPFPLRFPSCSSGALEAWLAQEKATRHKIDSIVRQWLIPPRHPLPSLGAEDGAWLALRLRAATHWTSVGGHFVLPIGYSTGAVYRTLLIDSWPTQLDLLRELLDARQRAYEHGRLDAQSNSFPE